MVLAVLTSAIFLVFYLVYHYHAGSVPFPGQGPTRWLYFTVLISHTFLATFGVVPLVFLTLLRALQRDFSRHRLIAATTFPIWVYVSVTGVLDLPDALPSAHRRLRLSTRGFRLQAMNFCRSWAGETRDFSLKSTVIRCIP